MRNLTPILLVVIALSPCSAALSSSANENEPAAVYGWEDSAGRLHFSNRAERVPSFATHLALAPVAIEVEQEGRRAEEEQEGWREPVVEVESGTRPRVHAERECKASDASGVASAVAVRLAHKRQIEGLTLLLASVPVAQAEGTVLTRVAPDEPAKDRFSAADQGAIAYPAGSFCPTRPPLPRYAVGAARRTISDGLCDDYRRAFAEVGVAASRNQGVAESFRRIAGDFTAASARGYVVAAGAGSGLNLPGWIIEAHAAQAEQIAVETSEFVSELALALEEIDRAARARGCW